MLQLGDGGGDRREWEHDRNVEGGAGPDAEAVGRRRREEVDRQKVRQE